MNEVSQEDRTMGMFAHLSALVVFGPLIIWLINKDQPGKSFINDNAKEALNLVISLWIVMLPVWVVMLIFSAIPVLGWIVALLVGLVVAALGIVAIVFIIMAAMKANEGIEYRYPFILRLIK